MDYQIQDFFSIKINELTVHEALDLYYSLNTGIAPWHSFETEFVQKTMKLHDITHIIFGCDTDYRGELRVQSWTFFGVDLHGKCKKLIDFWKYYTNPEMQTILKPIGYFNFFCFTCKNLHEVFNVWYNSN